MEGPDEAAASTAPVDRDFVERRRVIKNKILAVGRMAHLFSVLRWASQSLPVERIAYVFRQYLVVRSLSTYLSSKAYQALLNCPAAHSRLAPRASRTLSRHSIKRTFLLPRPHHMLDETDMVLLQTQVGYR
jgi:hypothetical protein